MPAVNDIAPETLRRLAEVRADGQQVLSVFLDLDPSRFATAEARATEITSVLDEAHRAVEERERPHAERMALRADLERIRNFLRDEPGYASHAHAVAAFACQALGLFETLRLPVSVGRVVKIAREPYITPLVQTEGGEELCVAIVDERVARILRGSLWTLREVLSFGDDVHGRQKTGGWSQARYQRSAAKDVDDHVRRVVAVLEGQLREQAYDRLLIGATQELWSKVESELPPDLRGRLAPRLSIDVGRASVDDVIRAAVPIVQAREREHEDELLGRMRQALATGGRAVSGLTATLEALAEKRVEVLLYDSGLERPGAECPQCGWLSEAPGSCPVDGTPMEPREDIVAIAITRALDQSAEVVALQDRPDLQPIGSIAALLRF